MLGSVMPKTSTNIMFGGKWAVHINPNRPQIVDEITRIAEARAKEEGYQLLFVNDRENVRVRTQEGTMLKSFPVRWFVTHDDVAAFKTDVLPAFQRQEAFIQKWVALHQAEVDELTAPLKVMEAELAALEEAYFAENQEALEAFQIKVAAFNERVPVLKKEKLDDVLAAFDEEAAKRFRSIDTKKTRLFKKENPTKADFARLKALETQRIQLQEEIEKERVALKATTVQQFGLELQPEQQALQAEERRFQELLMEKVGEKKKEFEAKKKEIDDAIEKKFPKSIGQLPELKKFFAGVTHRYQGADFVLESMAPGSIRDMLETKDPERKVLYSQFEDPRMIELFHSGEIENALEEKGIDRFDPFYGYLVDKENDQEVPDPFGMKVDLLA